MARKLSVRASKVAALIHSGTCTPSKIIERINQDVAIAYSKGDTSKEAQLKALQRDIQRLRDLGQCFQYNSRLVGYVSCEESPSMEILGLSQAEAAVLAQLHDLHRFSPYHDAAASLYDKVQNLLRPDSKKALANARPIQMVLPVLDELTNHMHTAAQVDKALRTRRELEFKYQMTGRAGPYEMQVQVLSPLELRDGHIYFDAYSVKSNTERVFRLNRVLPGSATVLPATHTGRARQAADMALEYWLAGAVEATRHFPRDFKIAPQDDGVIVSATIDERELFRAAKVLLRYGANCRVLQPPMLVESMRRTVEEMGRKYGLFE